MVTLKDAAQQALEELENSYPMQTTTPREHFEAITALRDALAEHQAQQEPVAWGMPRSDGAIIDCISPEEHAHLEGGYTVPLYASPQPRREVELTDEEIRDLWSWSMTAEAERTANTQQHAFARAVIAAYRAKQEKT